MYEDVLYETFDKIIALSKMAKGYMDALKDCKSKQNKDWDKSNMTSVKTIKGADEDMRLKDGHIRYRQDGRYELRYKEKSFYGKTKTEATNKFKEYLKLNKPQPKETKKDTTVEEWINIWFKTYKENINKEETIKNMRYAIKRNVINLIGKEKIKDIKNIQLQELINKINNLGNTKDKISNWIKDIFKKAYENKIINSNPAITLIVSNYETKHAVPLKYEEQKTLIDWNTDDKILKIYYLYVMYSGCRRNEALTLNIDKDITNKSIYICGTKTKGSKRNIPYFSKIQELFKGYSGQIFKELKPDYVSRNISKILPGHTIKDLRKTFSTNAYESGIKPKTIQKWMGHTTLSMTMNTYTEIKEEYEEKETKIFNDFDPNFDPNKNE